MATAGGGNFYYIADGRQITDYITSEVGEALDVVARDVESRDRRTVAPVTSTSLAPFPTERRGDRTVIRLPALVSGQDCRSSSG